MLYLGIDQHKSQLTVNLRSEDGSVILKRQASTQWEKVRVFFDDLAEKAGPEGGSLAILEVCGMNPWLLEMLKHSRPRRRCAGDGPKTHLALSRPNFHLDATCDSAIIVNARTAYSAAAPSPAEKLTQRPKTQNQSPKTSRKQFQRHNTMQPIHLRRKTTFCAPLAVSQTRGVGRTIVFPST
jgi:hypothetical protein